MTNTATTWADAKTTYEQARDAMKAAPRYGKEAVAASRSYAAAVRALIETGRAQADSLPEADLEWFSAEAESDLAVSSSAWRI